jgi:hypothetical protein
VVLVELAAGLLARRVQGLQSDDEQSRIAAEAISRAEKQKKGARMPQVETVVRKIRIVLDRAKELSDSSEQ